MKGAGRTLRSYLLLPRPGDLVKAWILPLGFALGALAGGPLSADELLRAACAWVALELLIYQARYQWNDIRGHASDLRHPQAAQRGRLPGPASRATAHVRASVAVAVLRIAIVGAIAALLPSLAATLAALAVSVFALAVLYEVLRSRGTGTSEQVPPPLRPAIVALWLVSGGGYAIRGVAGLALSGVLAGRPGIAIAAVASAWSFGVAFVTIRWAIEAVPFARLRNGRVIWEAEAGQAREHSLALVRWLPETADAAGGDGLAHWRPLSGHTSMRAPWNLATTVAGGAAATLGFGLAGASGAVEIGLAALCGGAGAAALLASQRRPPALLIGAGVLAVVAQVAGAQRPWLAILPWMLVTADHVLFASQSCATLAHPLRAVWQRSIAGPPGGMAGGQGLVGTPR